MRLDGKVAFITGSTRGIGWATAEAFAGAGAKVILNGRSDQALIDERAASLTDRFGVECGGIRCDVADPAQVRAAYQIIFKQWRRLDVLVNNAGVLDDALVGMISDTTIERTLAVNTAAAIHNLQAAARLMGRTGGGSIINVTSIIGVRGNAGQAVYGTSKAGLIGLTLSAAKELAPKQIRVNAVAPGVIDTDMIRAIPAEKLAALTAGIGLGRVGKPEDVAAVILFLASDLASYVTGQIVGVDGGMVV